MRREAREALAGKWLTAVGLVLVIELMMSLAGIVALIPVIGWVAVIFVAGVLQAGLMLFALNLLKGEAQFEDGFSLFNEIVRLGGATFMVGLFTFLWSLLFIIPGIVKSFSYSMTIFIMLEDKEISIMDAITKSREMMDGNKFDLFALYLSFIGWAILCMFTFGIGFLWLSPYVLVSTAVFYNSIKPAVKTADEMPQIVDGV